MLEGGAADTPFREAFGPNRDGEGGVAGIGIIGKRDSGVEPWKLSLNGDGGEDVLLEGKIKTLGGETRDLFI